MIYSRFCCPVCGAALYRTQTQDLCTNGHGFDLAKEGYVNLLPANRKHSREPGDDREMVRARSLFLDAGYYAPLRAALCRQADSALSTLWPMRASAAAEHGDDPMWASAAAEHGDDPMWASATAEHGDDPMLVSIASEHGDDLMRVYAAGEQGVCPSNNPTDAEQNGPTLLDAGCGEGYYTAALAGIAAAHGGKTLGVDLSKAAVRKAAKRCRAAVNARAELAVASVYHLPVADASVDVLVDCFSPLAIGEFRRVLRPGGIFLYVVPGPRHLWELKRVLYDNPYENEEKTEAYPGFTLLDELPVQTQFTLQTPELIRALFHMTPYTWKTPRDGAARLEALQTLTVQAQFRICCYRRTDA